MDETVNLTAPSLRGFESLSAHMISKKELQTLYNKGLSMKEISMKLDCSNGKIVYWINKYNILTRSRSEATYVKRNPGGDPFTIKKITTIEDIKLFYLGIALYLGEGEKRGKHIVRLANSDPGILRIFLKFLYEICGVREEKIRAEINMFDDIDKDKSVSYWMNKLNINKSQIRTIIIRKSKGGTYKNKSQYGTLTIYVSNSKLKKIAVDWCKETVNEFAKVAQSAEHTHGKRKVAGSIPALGSEN